MAAIDPAMMVHTVIEERPDVPLGRPRVNIRPAPGDNDFDLMDAECQHGISRHAYRRSKLTLPEIRERLTMVVKTHHSRTGCGCIGANVFARL